MAPDQVALGNVVGRIPSTYSSQDSLRDVLGLWNGCAFGLFWYFLSVSRFSTTGCCCWREVWWVLGRPATPPSPPPLSPTSSWVTGDPACSASSTSPYLSAGGNTEVSVAAEFGKLLLIACLLSGRIPLYCQLETLFFLPEQPTVHFSNPQIKLKQRQNPSEGLPLVEVASLLGRRGSDRSLFLPCSGLGYIVASQVKTLAGDWHWALRVSGAGGCCVVSIYHLEYLFMYYLFIQLYVYTTQLPWKVCSGRFTY